MKKILITGANSYIGTSFENHICGYEPKYKVDTLDMKDEKWEDFDFLNYDVVFHVAGIAHVSSDLKEKDLYYKINRDLTVSTAKKAKEAGVGLFIFMSSIIIYTNSNMENGLITCNTIPKCDNFYGNSKIMAEYGILGLEDDSFKIAILRPPMIYGNNSKGNFPRLVRFAEKMPFFPDYDNKRSMLHVDNLCEFIKLVIDNNDSGIFYPQNAEYVNTSYLVKLISRESGKDIKLTKVFNWAIKLLIERVNILKKVFGNLMYDKDLSEYKYNYQIRSLEESIKLSVTADCEDKQ